MTAHTRAKAKQRETTLRGLAVALYRTRHHRPRLECGADTQQVHPRRIQVLLQDGIHLNGGSNNAPDENVHPGAIGVSTPQPLYTMGEITTTENYNHNNNEPGSCLWFPGMNRRRRRRALGEHTHHDVLDT